MHKTTMLAVCLVTAAGAATAQSELFASGREIGSANLSTFSLDYTADFAGGTFSLDAVSFNGAIRDVTGAPLSGGRTGAAFEGGRYFVSNVDVPGLGLWTGSVDLASGVFTPENDQARTPALGIPGEPVSATGDARALGSNSALNAVAGLTTDSVQFSFDATTGAAVAPNIATIVPPLIEATAFASLTDTGYTISTGGGGPTLTSIVDPFGDVGGPFVNLFALPFAAPVADASYGLAFDDDTDTLIASVTTEGLGLTEFWAIEALPGGLIGGVGFLGTVDAEIGGLAYVPAPGVATVFGVGGLLAARRRR